MAITVKQFRYYGEGDSRNYPRSNDGNTSLITKANLKSGSIFFKGNPGVITMLGINFTLINDNDNTFQEKSFEDCYSLYFFSVIYLNNAEQPTIIGSVGNYQLDLTGLGELTSIRFDEKSLTAIDNSNNGIFGGTEHLIVDAIFESGD